MNVKFTIVVLTFERNKYLEKLLSQLGDLDRSDLEIIVVDNSPKCSAELVVRAHSRVKYIGLGNNLGAAEGRNIGNSVASGKYVLNLDDDVFGLCSDDLHTIETFFNTSQRIGAVCFRILDTNQGGVTNWCHHRDPVIHSNSDFQTQEISEGAVAYLGDLLRDGVRFPEEFFISHEGADLAWEIMNRGFEVWYLSKVSVFHEHAKEARVSWRRYYYDTRNLIWLAVRKWNFGYSLRKVPIGLIALGIYSLRDGFLRYWIKGIFDGAKGVPKCWSCRRPPTDEVCRSIRIMERDYMGLLLKAKKRILQRSIRL